MKVQNHMKPQEYYSHLAIPADETAPRHFRSIEIRGRHVIADGEYLHELCGDVRDRMDGGSYDAALV